MSKATKCDRCGGFYEQGGRSIRKGFGVNMAEFDLCADCAEAFDAWMECQPVTDAPERVTNQAEMLHDTREQLESYVTLYLTDKVCTWGKQRHELRNEVIRWLDRQAAITEQECAWRWQQIAEDRDRAEMECDELSQRIQTLELEIATLKEHRAANMEKIHGLTDECAELRKYRDEWKGLAEKYRADSIAAQAETERYRAKLGDVLDAIHEAERAAR